MILEESGSEPIKTTQHSKEKKTSNKSLHYDKIEKLIIEEICKDPIDIKPSKADE